MNVNLECNFVTKNDGKYSVEAALVKRFQAFLQKRQAKSLGMEF